MPAIFLFMSVQKRRLLRPWDTGLLEQNNQRIPAELHRWLPVDSLQKSRHTSVNPVRSMQRYFGEEYRRHDGRAVSDPPWSFEAPKSTSCASDLGYFTAWAKSRLANNKHTMWSCSWRCGCSVAAVSCGCFTACYFLMRLALFPTMPSGFANRMTSLVHALLMLPLSASVIDFHHPWADFGQETTVSQVRCSLRFICNIKVNAILQYVKASMTYAQVFYKVPPETELAKSETTTAIICHYE